MRPGSGTTHRGAWAWEQGGQNEGKDLERDLNARVEYIHRERSTKSKHWALFVQEAGNKCS